MQTINNNFSDTVHKLQQTDNKKKHTDNKQVLGQQVSLAAHEKNSVNKTDLPESAASIAKRQLNQAIMQASVDVSISSGNKPMELLYKSAIEGINEVLGEDAIQNAYDSGIDTSPEATAGRIVSMSTAFFGSYQEQHPDMSQEEAATSFTELIRGGIDKGFDEAKDILSGLKVLEGDISDNIDKTYELVQSGLDSFLKQYGPSSTEEE